MWIFVVPYSNCYVCFQVNVREYAFYFFTVERFPVLQYKTILTTGGCISTYFNASSLLQSSHHYNITLHKNMCNVQTCNKNNTLNLYETFLFWRDVLHGIHDTWSQFYPRCTKFKVDHFELEFICCCCLCCKLLVGFRVTSWEESKINFKICGIWNANFIVQYSCE